MTSPNQANPASSNPSNWDARAMMGLWDRLQAVPRSRRGVAVAGPWVVDDASLGDVQAAALHGYLMSFGDRIECQDQCPECQADLGVSLSVRALLEAHENAPERAALFEYSDWSIRYRLPRPSDMDEVSASVAPSDARAQLIALCVEEVLHREAPELAADLPEEVIERLAQRLEAEDPLAAAEMALTCSECGAAWEAGFDACAVFLSRLESWARRTLWEVHQLAMRYGWSEAELLRMTPVRREAYLLMDAP